MWPWAIAGLSGWMALTLLMSLRAFRRRTHMSAMPTSKVRGVAIGEVEVSGIAESPAPVTSFLSESPCVWHQWTCEEHWTRTRQETYRDSKGNTRTRTVTYSGTEVVAEGGDAAELYLRDDTGAVRVRWEGADVEPIRTFTETVRRRHPLYHGKGPSGSVAGSDGVRTFAERAIPVGTALFVSGFARERQDRVEPEIAAGEPGTGGGKARHFLVTTRSESQVLAGHALAGWAWAIAGALPVAGTLALGIWEWVDEASSVLPDAVRMERGQSVTLVGTCATIAFAGLYLVAWIIMVFNDLIGLRNRALSRLANIDVQLRRRSDLVQALAGCVEGLRRHESELQAALAQLRAQAAVTGHADPGIASLRRADRAIAVLAERYPQLTAGEAFLSLQRELSRTEDRIALARDDANGSAAGFNARIGTFPARLIASGMGLHALPFFAFEGFERAPAGPSSAG